MSKLFVLLKSHLFALCNFNSTIIILLLLCVCECSLIAISHWIKVFAIKSNFKINFPTIFDWNRNRNRKTCFDKFTFADFHLFQHLFFPLLLRLLFFYRVQIQQHIVLKSRVFDSYVWNVQQKNACGWCLIVLCQSGFIFLRDHYTHLFIWANENVDFEHPVHLFFLSVQGFHLFARFTHERQLSCLYMAD